MADIRIFPDGAALAQAAANRIIEIAQAAIATNGRFSMVLSGGSTPEVLYRLLASTEYAARLDWSNVHLFWGDERCVPPDHTGSNFRMAQQALIDYVPIPSDHIWRMQGELDPEVASQHYEDRLRMFFRDIGRPRFDVVLLGMGDDGHTASLFPGTPALVEARRWVVPNYVDKLGVWRITLTLPAINAAQNILFLVAGAKKSSRLREVLQDEAQAVVLPSQLIHPIEGQLVWMVDETAASALA